MNQPSYAIAGTSIISTPLSLYQRDQPKNDKRRILPFTPEEILVEHGIVYRIEFRETRCNLTLKNVTKTGQSVNVRVWILNKALIELWHQSESWFLHIQPDQSHLVSWEFTPAVPDVVWNTKARDPDPAWIVIDAL